MPHLPDMQQWIQHFLSPISRVINYTLGGFCAFLSSSNAPLPPPPMSCFFGEMGRCAEHSAVIRILGSLKDNLLLQDIAGALNENSLGAFTQMIKLLIYHGKLGAFESLGFQLLTLKEFLENPLQISPTFHRRPSLRT